MPSKCQQCDKVANYGLAEILHCGDHRLPNEKNLRAKYCDECDRQASFGFLVPSKCSDHKLDDMTDLKHKSCNHPGCDKRQAKGSFCSEHGTGKNTKHRTCYCGKIASYSNEGGRPEFCNDHKEPGMVNVKNKPKEEVKCLEHGESKCDLCFYELNPTSERTINHNYKSSMINEMISLPDWAEIKLDTSKSSKKLVIRLNLDSYRKDGKLVKSCFVEQPSKSLAEGKPVKINKKKLNERIKLCLDEVARFTSEPDNQIEISLP